MTSRLGGNADRNWGIFPFVALYTQSFICCRLFITAGSEPYKCRDLLTKSCFGWNPETHEKYTHKPKYYSSFWASIKRRRWRITSKSYAVVLLGKNDLGTGRSAWRFGGRCFGAPIRRYSGIHGSRGDCVDGDAASAAPASHLWHLRATEQ